MSIARASVIGLAGLVGAGVLAWPAVGETASNDEVYFKRQETDVELVAQDDEDDDDTVDKQQRDTRSRDLQSRDDRSRDVQSRGDQVSRDATNSPDSAVSRDRDVSRGDMSRDDVSRGDMSRDATRDGGTRSDWSADATNDVSRHDDNSRADSRR